MRCLDCVHWCLPAGNFEVGFCPPIQAWTYGKDDLECRDFKPFIVVSVGTYSSVDDPDRLLQFDFSP